MVPRYGLGGISLWTVGGEDPNQWARLWSMAGLSTSPYDPRVASQTQVEAFVQALYRDLLGRGADAGGLAFWTSELRSGRLSRDSAALGLTGSQEYGNVVTTREYQSVLGRNPDPVGLAGWSAAVASRALDESTLRSSLIASAEFYGRVGSNDTAWVTALYRLVLQRDPDPSGLAGWVSATRTLA